MFFKFINSFIPERQYPNLKVAFIQYNFLYLQPVFVNGHEKSFFASFPLKMAVENKKIRIKDIAELTGVSVGTVDRVLHDRGEVSEVTRKKVIKIIDRLHYKPNIFARTLAIKHLFKIAALIPEIKSDNLYWESPFIGISKSISELKNFNTEVEVFQFNQFDNTYFVKQLKKIIALKPDGILIVPSFFPSETAELIGEIEKLNIPYVFIDSNIEEANSLCYIGQDSFKSGYLAGKMLEYGLKETGEILIIKIETY